MLETRNRCCAMVLDPCSGLSNRTTADSGVVISDDIFAGERGSSGIPNLRLLSSDVKNKTEDASRRKNRKLWRVVKALLMEISPVKKIRNRKSRQKQRRSDSESAPLSKATLVNIGKQKLGDSSSSDADRIVNVDPVPSPISLTHSTSTNPSMCSSRTFRSNSSMSSSCSDRKFRSNSSKQNEIGCVCSPWANPSPSSSRRSTSRSISSSKQGGPTIGLYHLLTVILVLVVCWGKVCAIFFASTWLIVVPGRIIRKKTESLPSAECKKRARA